MNFKDLEHIANLEAKKNKKESDKFWCRFLFTVKETQSLSALYKVADKESKPYIKARIRTHAETLKCFIGCLKK